jgi:hypothetical protein
LDSQDLHDVVEQAMTDTIRVALEFGPNGKRVAAVAPDWPGLSRGAKTEDAALEQLLSYLPRYAPVAKLAGMEATFAAIAAADVVERYPGTGSTDFWGISFAFSSIDRRAMSRDEMERELALMRACWAFFDDVRSRVSVGMQKGPRGGTRPGSDRPAHTGCGAGLGEKARDGVVTRRDADRRRIDRASRRLR